MSNVDGKTVREETNRERRILPRRVGRVAMLIYLLLGTLLIFASDNHVVIADARASTGSFSQWFWLTASSLIVYFLTQLLTHRVLQREIGSLFAVVDTNDRSDGLPDESRMRIHSTVFNSIMEGVAVTNAAGNIISVNPAFTHITGYLPEEVLGQNPRIMKSGRHDQEFYNKMWESIAQHGSWSGEIWNRRKSGKIQPEWLNITRVCNDAGEATHYVASFIDTSAIKASQEQLHHLAHHDNLTGLPNRLLFKDRLEQSFKKARREHHRVAVLFLDLDDFKKVNDTLGHQVGDEMLKQAAKRIQCLLREGDTVARLGGDEFTILIDRLERAEDASLVANKVLATLKQPFNIVGRELYIGVSIGIAIFPQDGENTETLVRNADVSMYRAKQMGKNHFQFYTEELSRTANQKIEQEGFLRKALEKEQLRLFFQPQVSIASGAVVGAEALLRWQHPEKGLIYPCDFIPLAEETGLILSIGEWVLHSACRQLRAWDEQGITGLRMAVNISSIQILRADLVKLVQTVLTRNGVEPHRLELEIRENFIMERADRHTEVIAQLKAIGVGISINDFGAGYSSIRSLQQMPVDRIKLGVAIFEGVPSNRSNSMIAGAIASLGKNFGIQIVAEGIETEAQRRFASEIGCETGQGFLYGEALTSEEFTRILDITQGYNTG